jgi:DNA-binding MarR family transcriptional regulator
VRRARYAEEVNPTPPPGESVSEALGTLLRRDTRARLYGMLTEGLGPAVDPVTYPVLSGLARTGPRSAAGLAEEIGLDRSGVTRRASRLEEAGLLRREEDPHDQRATLLVLTDAGESTVETMRRRLAAHLQSRFDQWPPGQAANFAESLHRFVSEWMDLDS